MGLFTQVLLRALGETADAGIRAYGQSREPAPDPRGAKKRRAKCEPCAALKAVEQAKARVAKGKL